MREFSHGRTPVLEPAVIDVLGGPSPSEFRSVAAYTSSLPALRAK
jgi:hypothetical protein